MTGPVAPAPAGTIDDWAKSVIRTVVPFGVATVAGLISAHSGWTLSGETQAALDTQVVAVVFVAYYALVRALELRWPALGVLLGWKAAPLYTATAVLPTAPLTPAQALVAPLPPPQV